MAVPPVDVVVVAYNSRDDLRGSLHGLLGHDWVHPIVVDNASPDRSYEVVEGMPGVRVLRMPRNGGFSYGCNAGWRAGSSPYVLFLNPDASIAPADLERLAGALAADERVGVAGPRILHEDGSLDYSIRRFPSLRSTYAQALFLHRLLPKAPWTDELVRDEEHYRRRGTVDWLSGACLLVRRTVLEQIGGFDEGFFLYGEDIDICRRVTDAGFAVLFEPDAVCRHAGGSSHPRAALLPVLAASRLRYARKHRDRLGAFLEQAGIGLGEAVHGVAGRGGKEMRRGHLRAFRMMLTGTDSYRPAGAS